MVGKVFRETNTASCIFVDFYNIRSIDNFCRKYSAILARELFDRKDDILNLTQKLSPRVSFDQYGNPDFSLNVNKHEKQVVIETILEIPNKIYSKKEEKI